MGKTDGGFGEPPRAGSPRAMIWIRLEFVPQKFLYWELGLGGEVDALTHYCEVLLSSGGCALGRDCGTPDSLGLQVSWCDLLPRIRLLL